MHTIKLNYKPKEQVWFMQNNKINNGRIYRIDYTEKWGSEHSEDESSLIKRNNAINFKSTYHILIFEQNNITPGTHVKRAIALNECEMFKSKKALIEHISNLT